MTLGSQKQCVKRRQRPGRDDLRVRNSKILKAVNANFHLKIQLTGRHGKEDGLSTVGFHQSNPQGRRVFPGDNRYDQSRKAAPTSNIKPQSAVDLHRTPKLRRIKNVSRPSLSQGPAGNQIYRGIPLCNKLQQPL